MTAIVTGGARRIGRKTALALARAGLNVAITYRTSKGEAEETLGAIRRAGVRARALAMDVRDEASVCGAIAAIAEEFGRIDVLVNNAAVFEAAPLAEITLEQWDAMFASNTRGPFLVSREALPHLKAAEGRIVNIGSLGGSHAWATHGHYCTSKAALHMLTQVMAKAFAPEVSVNCVAPGYIEIEPGPEAAHFAAKTPMGRNATAEDVAAAVVFFATGPRVVTGQLLTVDGGLGL